jgi:hypothetical protein
MQLVVNPSFDLDFAGWRFQGGDFVDTQATGVRSGQGRTGANAYQAAETQSGWFVDISQNLTLLPNTAYTMEF